jgi:hypothetical protein
MQKPEKHSKPIAAFHVPCAGKIVTFGLRPEPWVLIRTEDGDAVLVGAEPLGASPSLWAQAASYDEPDIRAKVIRQFCDRVWEVAVAVAVDTGESGPTRAVLRDTDGEPIADIDVCKIGGTVTFITRAEPLDTRARAREGGPSPQMGG